MTAITTGTVAARAATAGTESQLLRFALRADATLCAGVGLFVAMAADPLARLSGLSPTAEWAFGAALVAYGALLYLSARVADVRLVGVGVLAGNIVFAVATTVVLAAGWLPLTGFGVAATVALTAVTLGFAALQYLGIRRLV